jgi:hypothetical protein
MLFKTANMYPFVQVRVCSFNQVGLNKNRECLLVLACQTQEQSPVPVQTVNYTRFRHNTFFRQSYPVLQKKNSALTNKHIRSKIYVYIFNASMIDFC